MLLKIGGRGGDNHTKFGNMDFHPSRIQTKMEEKRNTTINGIRNREAESSKGVPEATRVLTALLSLLTPPSSSASTKYLPFRTRSLNRVVIKQHQDRFRVNKIHELFFRKCH